MKKKVALFGATGGLGIELQKFLREKYDVICLSSKDVDVTQFKDVNDFFSANKPEIVVNLAGVNYDSFVHKIDENNIVHLHNIVNVNILGSVNITSCALKQMRAANYGRIILISSILSKKVVMGTAVYSASKAFIDNLVKTASAENCAKGITCNSLQLGYFDGGMCHRLPPAAQEAIKNMIPSRRWGKIEELASTIDYLINTEYVTGQNIDVSGGLI